jgi:lipid-A-disaccharide synthase
MKFYIIAGEASGDLHASALITELRQSMPNATFRCWGGDEMAKQDVQLVKHIRDLQFMGFVEVIKNLKQILSNLKLCKKDIETYQPDAIIFVDYPGFNLRIAKWAKQRNFKTIYYISPQIWAWKESRVHDIKRDIDLMLCILPFEKSFYQRHNHPVHYVGHPLVARINHFKQNNMPRTGNKKIIALLPGSRLQEIEAKLPVMLSVVQYFPSYQFIIAQSPTLTADVYAPYTKHFSNVSLVQHATYNILHTATAALVTSGTATLETALFGVPQVVCYKANAVSYLIAKQLVNIKYISLVNLIADRQVLTELIQHDLTTTHLTKELKKILQDDGRHQMLQDYRDIELSLSNNPEHENASALILAHLRGVKF